MVARGTTGTSHFYRWDDVGSKTVTTFLQFFYYINHQLKHIKRQNVFYILKPGYLLVDPFLPIEQFFPTKYRHPVPRLKVCSCLTFFCPVVR